MPLESQLPVVRNQQFIHPALKKKKRLEISGRFFGQEMLYLAPIGQDMVSVFAARLENAELS